MVSGTSRARCPLRIFFVVGCFFGTSDAEGFVTNQESGTCSVDEQNLSLLQSSTRMQRIFAKNDGPIHIPHIHIPLGKEVVRKKSSIGGCSPVKGTKKDLKEKVKPCGFYGSKCTDLFTVERGVTYPGNDEAFDPKCGTDYIVQFDIGLNPNVHDIDGSISIREQLGFGSGETCLEVVVTDCDDWGNLGIDALPSGGYDKMGRCGAGALGVGDAMDCLKHDVCSAFKSAVIEGPATGFCDDPDCGDEAAQTLFNCKSKQTDEPTTCHCDGSTTGSWSTISHVFGGNCKAYKGCDKGQGIPSEASPGF